APDRDAGVVLASPVEGGEIAIDVGGGVRHKGDLDQVPPFTDTPWELGRSHSGIGHEGHDPTYSDWAGCYATGTVTVNGGREGPAPGSRARPGGEPRSSRPPRIAYAARAITRSSSSTLPVPAAVWRGW